MVEVIEVLEGVFLGIDEVGIKHGGGEERQELGDSRDGKLDRVDGKDEDRGLMEMESF